MFKNTLVVFAFALVFGLPVPAKADTQKVGDYTWTYTIADGKATILGGEWGSVVEPEPAGDLEIPSELGNCPVVRIGENAFNGCFALESVTIPSSVTHIGDLAFVCYQLKLVKIPKSVTDISDCAFTCFALEEFVVDEGNPAYSSRNRMLCSKDGKRLIEGVNGDAVIPDGVTSVSGEAFNDCWNLKSVTIPASVTDIDLDPISGGFVNCRALMEFKVAAENPVYSSRNGMLCSKDGETLIVGVNGDAAIPDGVKRIRNDAFYGRMRKSVTIPDNVEVIGDGAFAGCSELESVTIPSSVVSIGRNPFAGCSGLKGIEVAEGNLFYSSCDGMLCSKDGRELVAAANLAEHVAVPATVTCILEDAFMWTRGVKSVTVHEGVTEIGQFAFFNSDVESVSIPSSVASIGDHAFDSCYGLKTIYVRAGCEDNVKELLLDSGFNESAVEFVKLGIPTEEIVDGVTWCYEKCFDRGVICARIVLGDNACVGCVGKLTIPSSLGGCPVTSIGACAFENCGIGILTVPSFVRELGFRFFGGGLLRLECPMCRFVDESGSAIGQEGNPEWLSNVLDPFAVYIVCAEDVAAEWEEAIVAGGFNSPEQDYCLTADGWVVNGRIEDGQVIAREISCELPLAWDGTEELKLPTAVGPFPIVAVGYVNTCGSLENFVFPASFKSVAGGLGSVIDSGTKTITFEGGVPDGFTECLSAFWENEVTVRYPEAFADEWSTFVDENGKVRFSDRPYADVGNIRYWLSWQGGAWSIVEAGFASDEEENRVCPESLTLPATLLGHPVKEIGGPGVFCVFGAFANTLREVVIPGGYERINEYVFEDCRVLASVQVPSTLMSIGAFAFQHCTVLAAIRLPESLERIGEGAFAGCQNLQAVCFEGNRPTVGDCIYDWFEGECAEFLTTYVREDAEGWDRASGNWCGRPIALWTIYPGMPEVKILDGVYTVPNGDYDWTITIRNGAVWIGDSSGLAINPNPQGTVEIPESFLGLPVVGIEAWAFWWGDMTSVAIPQGVTSIGYGAFAYCENLETVRIPSSVVYIDYMAFFACRSLKANDDGVVVMDGCLLTVAENCPTSVDVPQGVRLIANGAFVDNKTIESVTIPSSVTIIGGGAFEGCSSLQSVSIPSGVRSIGNSTFGYCSSLKSVEIPEGVTNIGRNAFFACRSLESVSISDGVKSIGEMAFYGCAGLTSLSIPSSVASIGWAAFSGCTGLGDGVVIVDGCVLTVNGVCPASVELPQDVRLIAGSAFEDCGTLVSVTIPLGVTRIEPRAFSGCGSLASADIPSSVTSIGFGAFDGCYSLRSVTIPEGVTDIGYSAFSGCGLTSVEIPSSVTCIESGVFSECSNLASVEIPPSVTSIGIGAFSMSGLTSVEIPSSVRHIGGCAFEDCRCLERVDYYGNAPMCGNDIYRDTRETLVSYVRTGTTGWISDDSSDLPNSWQDRAIDWADKPDDPDPVADGMYVVSKDGYDWTVTVELGEVWIGDRMAWMTWQSAVSPRPQGTLKIPEELLGLPVVGLCAGAFANCDQLTELSLPRTFHSTVKDSFSGAAIRSITVDKDNPYYEMRDGFLITKQEWPILAVAVGKSGRCVIPDGVFFVDAGAFSLCPGLTELVIPATVVDFDSGAVDNCPELASIVVSEANPYLKSAEGLVLDSDGTTLLACPGGITDVVVPDGVKSVGYEVEVDFSGTKVVMSAYPFPAGSKMRSIRLPATVGLIVEGAFSACFSLKDIRIDKGNKVFSASDGLLLSAGGNQLICCAGGVTRAIVPDGVVQVSASAFAENSCLLSVTLPASVEKIGSMAFSQCPLLSLVCFEGDEPEVEMTGFADWFVWGPYEGSDRVTTYVREGAKGWEEETRAGTWCDRPIKLWPREPLPELKEDATVDEVIVAVNASKDCKVVENIFETCETEGETAGVELYNAYREWAGTVKGDSGDAEPVGVQAVAASPTAWTSFALDSETLLARNPTDEDLKVEEFVPAEESGKFDFTVSIENVTVGSKAMKETLKKTFGLEGAAELLPSAFNEANVDIEFGNPEGGNLKFTAGPADKGAKSFFMKMKVK